MSDIFDEVNAELRRDTMQAAWDKYGRYLIGGAVGFVVLVAAIIGTSSLIDSRQEAASVRYDAMLATLAEDDAQNNITVLAGFAEAENNGYGALARFSAAVLQAREGATDDALASFEMIADDGGLPNSLRDLAALQAAIVLLDTNGALAMIENRLDDLLEDGNGLQPMARETMALAFMANDQPLKAREMFKAQIADPTATSLTRERASIMLQSVGAALSGDKAPLTPKPAQPAEQ